MSNLNLDGLWSLCRSHVVGQTPSNISDPVIRGIEYDSVIWILQLSTIGEWKRSFDDTALRQKVRTTVSHQLVIDPRVFQGKCFEVNESKSPQNNELQHWSTTNLRVLWTCCASCGGWWPQLLQHFGVVQGTGRFDTKPSRNAAGVEHVCTRQPPDQFSFPHLLTAHGAGLGFGQTLLVSSRTARSSWSDGKSLQMHTLQGPIGL